MSTQVFSSQLYLFKLKHGICCLCMPHCCTHVHIIQPQADRCGVTVLNLRCSLCQTLRATLEQRCRREDDAGRSSLRHASPPCYGLVGLLPNADLRKVCLCTRLLRHRGRIADHLMVLTSRRRSNLQLEPRRSHVWSVFFKYFC